MKLQEKLRAQLLVFFSNLTHFYHSLKLLKITKNLAKKKFRGILATINENTPNTCDIEGVK